MKKTYSTAQTVVLASLRIAIGWHFLYEGIVKLLMPDWSAAAYLQVSSWIFASIFHWMANTPAILSVVNFMNIWGLILVGLALMTGIAVRPAAVGGMALLALYYVANPPFVGYEFGVPVEGHYLVVNKNLVELFALGIVLIFPQVCVPNLKAWFSRFRSKADQPKKAPEQKAVEASQPASTDRRDVLKGLVSIPALGAFGVAISQKLKWQSWEDKNLVDAQTSASTKMLNVGSLKELNGQLEKAPIGNHEYSRLILGGNLLSGWAHSRDLMYVSQLVKAYHNKNKIFATLLLAERCGINTLLTNPILCTVIDEYWKRNIGKIQFISDCAGLAWDANGPHAIPVDEYLDKIQRAIDYGAAACYIQGETADWYMSRGKADVIGKAIQRIQDNGVTVGIGSHRIETIKACVDAGFEPEFWMKTLHHHEYWSAKHPEWHDNKYCFSPEETIAYMESLPQPFIAFKVMAAGAIKPKEAFQYAFENGADFICAGMYDFQMVEDVNLAVDILNGKIERKRPWRAVS